MLFLRFSAWLCLVLLFDVCAKPQNTPVQTSKITSGANAPTFLQSDQLDYDDAHQVVTASGRVYVAQESQLLYADQVQYFKPADKVVAKGHVWLRDKDGNFSFADYVELSNKMADGFVDNIKVLMTDNARMAGNRAKRYEGKRVVVWQGVYSPCEVCKANPDRALVWQLKADKIIHDKEIQMVQYHHAWMEMFGWPVFYVPYFSHPDPAVKRKTGLLLPIYAHSKDLGYSITLPYFIASGQNHDFTFFPTFTTKQGIIPALEHRYRFDDGEYAMHGSYASSTTTRFDPNSNPNNYSSASSHRWHYFMNARYDVTPDVLFTMQVQRASDLTYLKRFPVLPRGTTDPFATRMSLTSTAALERFRSESYGVIRSYVFQADQQKRVPVVLPTIQYAYETLPGGYGETFMLDLDFLNLYREQGIVGRVAESMVRGSLGAGGQIPYISSWGDIWTLKAYMRGDLYYVDDYKPRARREEKNGTRHRYFPQASLTWRYPFLNPMQNMHWILEPAAMVTTSSIGGNSIDIPNEDTPVVLVDTTNLFLNNRMYGIDRVDSGHRFVYGIHSRQLFGGSRKFNLFFGQSIRIDKNQVLPVNSGEDNIASNFVSSVEVIPMQWLNLKSRLMFNRENMSVEVAESSGHLSSRWIKGSVSHIFYNRNLTFNHQRISQLSWNVIFGEYKGFTATYGERRNLSGDQSVRLLSREIALKHENECLISTFSVIRTGFRDRDFKPDTRIILQLDFKNLGTISPVNISGVGGLRDSAVARAGITSVN